jgi:signal transduction histidine kinase
MLGAILSTPEPYLTDDIHDDPRFRGWWPRGHPDMRSFLGVPILARGEIIGAFYLTEKLDAATFDARDAELIALLAAHAAIAITNARLYEQARTLTAVAERNRLALELHDAVSQKLFSLTLTAQAAATQLDRDPDGARTQLTRLTELATEALDELRALIGGLRPPDLARDGLIVTLRKELEMLSRVHGTAIDLHTDSTFAAGGDLERDQAILRIVGEAVHNALRHARARRITVEVRDHAIAVADDGAGFDPGDPAIRGRHLGLTSMEERARELGAVLEIDAAVGRGTTVRLELPR